MIYELDSKPKTLILVHFLTSVNFFIILCTFLCALVFIMSWIFVIIGGIFEVTFTFCLGKLKDAQGGSKIFWATFFVVALFLSMASLMKATQSLPIGTAYAVWTGIGAVGTVLMGIFFFNEPATFWRLVFITTLVASIIGLKVVSH